MYDFLQTSNGIDFASKDTRQFVFGASPRFVIRRKKRDNVIDT